MPETSMFESLEFMGCTQAFKDQWHYALFMNDLWHGLSQYKDVAAQVVAEKAQKKPDFVGPTRTVLDALGKAYANARRANVWGEKTPGHLVWLPQIYSLFPDARIIITIRDPRDILLSYDDRWGNGKRDTAFLMRSCAQVRHYFDHLLQSPAFPANQVCRVRYESLTSRPEEAIAEVCAFLEVPFEEQMLRFYRSHKAVEQEFPDGKYHKLLSRPVTSERVGRYKCAFTAAQIQLIEEFLGDHLSAQGYQPESTGSCLLSRTEQSCRKRGIDYYDKMRSGSVRRELRVQARARYKILRWLSFLPPRLFSRIATTSSAWEMRMMGSGVREGQAQVVSMHQIH